MRRPADQPFGDVWDPAKHPRGKGGLFVRIGEIISALAGKAGQNVVEHVPFARVRRPIALSKVVGVDVGGFRHAVSNQAIAHARSKHGVPAVERSRGQKPVDIDDFAHLPEIVKARPVLSDIRGKHGQPRLVYRQTIGGEAFTYVAEVRAGKKRLDAVTMWKR